MEGRVDKMTDIQHQKNVLYLSQRDHRASENYSLYLAYTLSEQSQGKLFVGTDFKAIKKNKIQEAFMVEGLKELKDQYKSLSIDYYVIDKLESFIADKDVDCIVTEFSPMRDVLAMQNKIKAMCVKKKLAFYVCDSHNLMPCKMITEYVRNFRGLKSRFYKQWDKYYKMHAKLKPHEVNKKTNSGSEKGGKFENRDYWKFENYNFGKTPKSIGIKGGYSNGMKELKYFVDNQLSIYNNLRKKPTAETLRTVAPWIDSGQISVYTVLSEIIKNEGMDSENVERYVTELVMWRQTAEHFCYYEKNYDNFDCALSWAKETLQTHQNDKRPYNYSLKDLESANTDNVEWNAAQKEMLSTGEMHPYVRFFWGKKLLYFTKNPKQAIEFANKMIDDLSFQGNHSIGYLNTMYSICGTMDQGWRETSIRGKIRGMDSIKSKEYVSKWANT